MAAPDIPPPASSQAAAQERKQAEARAAVDSSSQIRALAQQLAKSPYSFEPATFRKGIVASISPNSSPPTLTLNMSGDETVSVAGVRWLDSYAPQVGDTVLVLKQGPDILAVGHIAEAGTTGEGAGTGWTKANLGSGWTHNGNDMGDVEYRRVWDNGVWKMQWRGAAASTGSNDRIIAASSMGSDFRPGIKRKVPAARDYGGALPSCILRFEANGDVFVEGGSFTRSNSGTTGAAGDSHTHSHNGAVSQTSFVETHTHSFNGDLNIAFPNWISFNNVEYFI